MTTLKENSELSFNLAAWRMGSQDLDTWLITMVIVVDRKSPKHSGCGDPFQMAELHGL